MFDNRFKLIINHWIDKRQHLTYFYLPNEVFVYNMLAWFRIFWYLALYLELTLRDINLRGTYTARNAPVTSWKCLGWVRLSWTLYAWRIHWQPRLAKRDQMNGWTKYTQHLVSKRVHISYPGSHRIAWIKQIKNASWNCLKWWIDRRDEVIPPILVLSTVFCFLQINLLLSRSLSMVFILVDISSSSFTASLHQIPAWVFLVCDQSISMFFWR